MAAQLHAIAEAAEARAMAAEESAEAANNRLAVLELDLEGASFRDQQLQEKTEEVRDASRTRSSASHAQPHLSPPLTPRRYLPSLPQARMVKAVLWDAKAARKRAEKALKDAEERAERAEARAEAAEALLAASGAPAEARFKPLKANNTSRPKRDAQGRVVHPPWDPTPLGVAARELSF